MFSIYNDDLWLKISFRQVEFCETMAQGTTNLVLAAEWVEHFDVCDAFFFFLPYPMKRRTRREFIWFYALWLHYNILKQ